ncbi:hypothetical protein ACLB1Q_27695 [Escherichia coli]
MITEIVRLFNEAAITTEKALGKALDNNLISMVKTLEQEGAQVRAIEKIRAGRLAESDWLSARANAVGRTANEGVDNAKSCKKLPDTL